MRALSQIIASPANLTGADTLVGVTAAGVDVRYSIAQAAQGIDPALTGTTDFYVSLTGNDTTGTGSAVNPWRTLQHAADVVDDLELAGNRANINIPAGTFAGVDLTTGNLSGTIRFIGAGATTIVTPVAPSAGSASFLVEADLNIEVVNLTMLGTGIESGVFTFNRFSNVSFAGGNVYFDTLGKGITAQQGASVHIGSALHINGNMTNFIYSDSACSILYEPSTWTLTGTPNWSDAFVSINDQVLMHNIGVGTVTFVGGATGRRFFVADGGVIKTGTNNLAFFPGDAVGVIDPGGQYDNIVANTSGPFIVSTLPPAASVPAGQNALVTDSNATLAAGLGNVVVGLGGNRVPVYNDGLGNWRIG